MSKQVVRVGIQTNDSKDLYLRIVAPRYLFIKFIHKV